MRDPILNLLPTYDTRLAEQRGQRRLPDPDDTDALVAWYRPVCEALQDRDRDALVEAAAYDRRKAAEADATHKAVCDAVRDSLNAVIAERVAGMDAEDRAARAVVAAVNDAARRGRKTVKIAELVKVFTAAQNTQQGQGGAPDA